MNKIAVAQWGELKPLVPSFARDANIDLVITCSLRFSTDRTGVVYGGAM